MNTYYLLHLDNGETEKVSAEVGQAYKDMTDTQLADYEILTIDFGTPDGEYEVRRRCDA